MHYTKKPILFPQLPIDIRHTYDILRSMQRVSVYIPEDTRKRINFIAKAKSKAESEIIRNALEEGLERIYPKSDSAQALLDFSKKAENIPTPPGSPTDVSVNHDYYAWGGKKKKHD